MTNEFQLPKSDFNDLGAAQGSTAHARGSTLYQAEGLCREHAMVADSLNNALPFSAEEKVECVLCSTRSR